MGAKDNKITHYLQKPENFSGLFNGSVYNGEAVLTPDKLILLTSQQPKELSEKDETVKNSYTSPTMI